MDGQPLDCYDYLSTYHRYYGTNNMSPFLKIFLAVLNTECLEKYFRHFKMFKNAPIDFFVSEENVSIYNWLQRQKQWGRGQDGKALENVENMYHKYLSLSKQGECLHLELKTALIDQLGVQLGKLGQAKLRQQQPTAGCTCKTFPETQCSEVRAKLIL